MRPILERGISVLVLSGFFIIKERGGGSVTTGQVLPISLSLFLFECVDVYTYMSIRLVVYY